MLPQVGRGAGPAGAQVVEPCGGVDGRIRPLRFRGGGGGGLCEVGEDVGCEEGGVVGGEGGGDGGLPGVVDGGGGAVEFHLDGGAVCGVVVERGGHGGEEGDEELEGLLLLGGGGGGGRVGQDGGLVDEAC